MSSNRKTTKPLEKIIIFKGFSCFWTLLITKKCRKHKKQQYRLKKKACSRYYGVSPVSRHLFITKNVKKHEKLQSPLNKWLSQGILSFHLFLDILSYSKVSKNRKTTKSLEFLHLLQFLHNSTKTSAAGARQGTRSVPVISVPSRNEAWEVYPLEMHYPDDPTRLCRPKAGQSLWI